MSLEATKVMEEASHDINTAQTGQGTSEGFKGKKSI